MDKIEEIFSILKDFGDDIKSIKDRLEKLESIKPKTKAKTPVKYRDFEESYKLCENGDYSCMHVYKTGKNKGQTLSEPAVYYHNEDGERFVIKDKVPQDLWHSLRCEKNKDKGHANSESKKRCLEKIKGVNIKETANVDQQAFDFLAGKTEGIVSPTRALSPSPKSLQGTKYIKDNLVYYVQPFNDEYVVFEYLKNKNNEANRKKTPTLRGKINNDSEDSLETIKAIFTEDELKDLLKDRKYFYDGDIVKEEKDIIIPTLNNLEKEDEDKEDDEDSLGDNDIQKLLDGLELNEIKLE